MKKLLIFALAGLALVACKKNDSKSEPSGPTGEVTLSLDKSQASVKVGETVTINAIVSPAGTVVTWESSAPAIATVNNGVVTGVAKGNAIINAYAGDKYARCIVNVTEGSTPPSGETPKLLGDMFWPIYVDGEIVEQNASKLGYNFGVNNTDRNLYIWEGTYGGGTPSGWNYYRTQSGGGFLNFVVTDKGWSGLGFNIKSESVESKAKMNELIAAIKAEPEKYHFHMAIKSTDNYGHYFSLFGLGAGDANGLKWAVGDKYADVSMYKYDIVRDGSWNVIDFSFDKFIVPLSTFEPIGDGQGMNYFVVGTEGVQGAMLCLDALYIYKLNN